MQKLLHEVWQSLWAHVEKSIVTGIAISWGIFFLVIILGFGNSFEKTAIGTFSSFSKKTIYFNSGNTSLPFNGTSTGRKVSFTEASIYDLKNKYPQIEKLSKIYSTDQTLKLSYKNKSEYLTIKGVDTDYFSINNYKLFDGRFLNKMDLKENRRIAIIGDKLAQALKRTKKMVGENIEINNNIYKVAGIIETGFFNYNEGRSVYLPSTTLSHIHNLGQDFNSFVIVLNIEFDSKIFIKKVRQFFSKKNNFDQSDYQALS
jgi:putative ABC transport system permease protein